MKGLTLAVLAGAALLAGCASDAANKQAGAAAQESYTPLGSYIARKSPSRADNVTQVDKQAIENERIMGSGIMNGPGGK